MEKRLATLTKEENAAWEFAFAWYLNEGFSDDDADANTWADVQAEFPRLREFDGCKP